TEHPGRAGCLSTWLPFRAELSYIQTRPERGLVVVLRKPPIVEMWVEFAFDPNPDGLVESAIQFLKEYEHEFPTLEFAREDTLEFRQVAPDKLPEVVGRKSTLKHIRAHNKEGTRWLHLTPNQLACNYLRLGDEYPGFATVSQ